MRIGPFRRSRSAFTLIELLIVIAIIALLIGILLPAVGSARKSARMAVCLSNMRQFAVATASYAAENKDRMFGYSWVRGTPIPPDFARFLPVKSQYADNDMHGAAMQFTYIMQKRLNFKDPEKFAFPGGWFPYVYYSHIPLMDYMSAQMPMPVAACPEDKALKMLQSEYNNVESSGTPVPPNPGETDARWRFPFRMSYTVHSTHYSPDKVYNIVEEGHNKRAAIVYTSSNGVLFSDGVNGPESLPTGALGNRKLTDVRFPSQKTWGSDSIGRHFGRTARFFADPACREPLAFYDSSVRVYMTGDTNPGWNPKDEAMRKQMGARFAWTEVMNDYSPKVANSVTKTDAKTGQVTYEYAAAAGWFTMTRGGLRGWDVPRGAVRSRINGATMEYKVENELDTSVTNDY